MKAKDLKKLYAILLNDEKQLDEQSQYLSVNGQAVHRYIRLVLRKADDSATPAQSTFDDNPWDDFGGV